MRHTVTADSLSQNKSIYANLPFDSLRNYGLLKTTLYFLFLAIISALFT